MHQSLSLWILRLEKQLLHRGIEPLIDAAPSSVERLVEAMAWLCLCRPQPISEQPHSRACSDRLAAAWRGFGNGLQGLGLVQLAERALVAAQRQERRSGCSCNSLSRPFARAIHHFACSGGTVISKCVAAMPHVALLSEVNPLNRFGADPPELHHLLGRRSEAGSSRPSCHWPSRTALAQRGRASIWVRVTKSRKIT